MQFEIHPISSKQTFEIQAIDRDKVFFRSREILNESSARKILAEIEYHYSAENLSLKISIEKNKYQLLLCAPNNSTVASSDEFNTFEECVQLCKEAVVVSENKISSCSNS